MRLAGIGIPKKTDVDNSTMAVVEETITISLMKVFVWRDVRRQWSLNLHYHHHHDDNQNQTDNNQSDRSHNNQLIRLNRSEPIIVSCHPKLDHVERLSPDSTIIRVRVLVMYSPTVVAKVIKIISARRTNVKAIVAMYSKRAICHQLKGNVKATRHDGIMIDERMNALNSIIVDVAAIKTISIRKMNVVEIVNRGDSQQHRHHKFMT